MAGSPANSANDFLSSALLIWIMLCRTRLSARRPLRENQVRRFVLMLFARAARAFTPTLRSCAAISPSLYQDMRWRMIGPFRGGRTRAACGVPSQPNVFYMAQVNGGVWKSDDFGRTWEPIFDDQPTQSIGAIAVAPSDPNIVYVASGEGLQRPDLSVGDGIYKSTDAGQDLDAPRPARWPADSHPRHRSRTIPTACLRRCSATLTVPNEERGIYRIH